MAALVAAITSGRLPLQMARHDDIIPLGLL